MAEPPAPAPASFAPPSLSVRVECSVDATHPMYGLFVILRIAVAGTGHPTIDKVVAVHDGGPAATETLDEAALATRFVCTIVDGNGYLQPVHDGTNPWHEIGAPPRQKGKKKAPPAARDMARLAADPDVRFVGCLLRHPEPSMARALTRWLNGDDDDPEGRGFASWPKARPAPFAGEKTLRGRELYARELTLSKDTSQGTQLVLRVSEEAADFLPPKLGAHGGWLLYRDMPHAACEPVLEQVKALQRRLGLLRYPVGSDANIYAPDGGNVGVFDVRTLSAVRAFQQHAAAGKATKPAAWPPNDPEASDGRHDYWFIVGTDVVEPADVAGVLPGCADEKTWAAIDAWMAKKIRKPGMIMVKNPDTYMRWDAALAVLAWRKLAAVFGVHYPQSDPNYSNETELASQYSLAPYEAGLTLDIAHPHKTGHALDFGVVIQDDTVPDYSRPRPNWPIHYEGTWWIWSKIDTTQKARAALAAAKRTQKNAARAADAAKAKPDAVRDAATAALATANDAVDAAQKDVDAEIAKDKAAMDSDPEHRGWAIHFRLYAHGMLDAFGDADGALDKLYASVSGMTEALKKSLVVAFGDTPADLREAFLTANLGFFFDLETKLLQQIGPPATRNVAGRAELIGMAFRKSVRQWIYNPYSRAGGEPGPVILPGADSGSVGYLDAELDSATPNVPAGAKSFVNLSYLGWLCKMHRISGAANTIRDPHKDKDKAPRQKIAPVSAFFGRVVGLVDRMQRSDSNEKEEPLVFPKQTRHLADLDVEFMKRWARALPGMRPRPPRGVPVVVTTNDPQVTLELVAKPEGLSQLQAVFDALDKSGKNLFVLVDAGKSALLDPALIADSGKPGIVEADKGRLDTGAAWRAKLENVVSIFKEKVVPANVPAADKAAVPPGKKAAPVRSENRKPKDWQITLQPVFEKTAPNGLEDVTFQPQHSCVMPTPGQGVQLEWWHHQHEDSIDVKGGRRRRYDDMLDEIGYSSEYMFLPEAAPAADARGVYPGRGVGAHAAQRVGLFAVQTLPKAPENGDTDDAKVW